MSTSLIRAADHSTAFQQQGQIDWVALSTSAISISVEAARRLRRGDIDLDTLVLGKEIGRIIGITSDFELEINEAIANSKRYPYFDGLLWVGRGLKGVVDDLAASKEGLSLIALCSTLTAAFNNAYAAEIFRGICEVLGANPQNNPAQRYWQALIRSCSDGLFIGSNFAYRLEGFSKMISGSLLEASQRPAHPRPVAEALIALVLVQQGKSTYLSISGGADCGWLAAFAQEVLSLDIAIKSDSDVVYHRSPKTKDTIPQVIFRSHSNPRQAPRVVESTLLVPMNHRFIQLDCMDESRCVSTIRSSWDTILRDTFRESIEYWLTEGGREYLASVLHHLSTDALLYYREEQYHQADPFLQKKPSKVATKLQRYRRLYNLPRGMDFLQFAARTLPELAWLKSSRPRPIDVRALSEWLRPTNDPQRESIQRSRCDYCVFERCNGYSCVHLAAYGTFLFLDMLASSDIDEGLTPSSLGLRKVCEHLSESRFLDEKNLRFASIKFNTQLVKAAFTDGEGNYFEEPTDFPPTSDPHAIALSGDGICVHRYGINDPIQQIKHAAKFRILRGIITYGNDKYRAIVDRRSTEHLWGDLKCPTDNDGRGVKVEALLNDPQHNNALHLGYRVSLPGIHGEGQYWGFVLEEAISLLSDDQPQHFNLPDLKHWSGHCEQHIGLVEHAGSVFRVSDLVKLEETFKQSFETGSTLIFESHVNQDHSKINISVIFTRPEVSAFLLSQGTTSRFEKRPRDTASDCVRYILAYFSRYLHRQRPIATQKSGLITFFEYTGSAFEKRCALPYQFGRCCQASSLHP